MIKVKISCANTSQAKDHKNPMVNKFLPNWGNSWKNCEFYWNDDSIKEADYWIIFQDIYYNQEQCLCPKENVLFMSGETEATIRYDLFPEFINQFYRTYLSHKNVKHPRAFEARSAMNWWVDAGHPIKTADQFNSWQGQGFGYDDFKKMTEYNKTKTMSVFCSNKISSPGHRQRYEFTKKAKEFFKDKLDWFGSGIRNIDSKWDGIAPYKYHISLENGSHKNYWTEKLADCYMAGAYPIYYGAPNIYDYFDKDSITPIDIRYPKSTFALIEKLIAENTYEKAKPKILEAKNLILDKYNIYNMMAEIVERDGNIIRKKELITIKNWQYFWDKNLNQLKKDKKSLPKRIFRSLTKKANKLKLLIVDHYLLLKLKYSKK